MFDCLSGSQTNTEALDLSLVATRVPEIKLVKEIQNGEGNSPSDRVYDKVGIRMGTTDRRIFHTHVLSGLPTAWPLSGSGDFRKLNSQETGTLREHWQQSLQANSHGAALGGLVFMARQTSCYSSSAFS